MKKILYSFCLCYVVSLNAQSWSLQGNSLTNPSNNFLGTLNTADEHNHFWTETWANQ